MKTVSSMLAVALGAALAMHADAARAGTVTGTVQHAKGNANMVVSVLVPGATVTPPAKHPTIDQKDMTFVPHVLAVAKGTTVDFKNDDPVNHNVFSPDGEAYNLGTWPQGNVRSYTFAATGVYTQLCSLHPEMEGFIVVVDTPYYAVTDAQGHFAINGVPDGKYTVDVWGPKLKKAEKAQTFSVEVSGGKGSLAITWVE